MRNCAIAAMEIGALARLFPNRFTPTFGHGVREWMDQIGALPRQRMAALAEVTAAVRALLAGETVTVRGSYVELEQVVLEPPPEHRPPVLVGTTGRRGLALAGAVADGFLLPEGCGPNFIARAVQQASDAATSDRAPISVVYAWLRVDDDDDQARMALRPTVQSWLEWGLFPDPIAASGAGSKLPSGPVPASLAAELAIAGDPATCARAALRFTTAGAGSLILSPVGPDPDGQLARFAQDVMPIVCGQVGAQLQV
jgi:alkanesulfonate monooxygenase SsuD/methylene tetrahydromethanopterin reductase-like flavin-dependent oxidoreductase (luciferase family)